MILFGINFTFCIALPLPLLLIALDLKFEGFMFFFFFIVQNMGARKYGHASEIFYTWGCPTGVGPQFVQAWNMLTL